MTHKRSDQDLPYEKFCSLGPDSLTESELLAIIIRSGTKENSAFDISKKVLAMAQYPRAGLLGLYDLSIEDLMTIPGVGEVTAVKLKSITELSKRLSQARAKEEFLYTEPSSVAKYFMERLRHLETECVWMICLDSKGQILHEKRLSDGSVNMSLISSREIFMEALKRKAVNIILIHNHPSGDPSPSSMDIETTVNVHKAGDLLGVHLLDHIIIGDNRYASLKALGYI